MAKRPPNDGSAWSAAELKKLQSLAKKGFSANATAEQLGRTSAAVQQKAMRAQISFRGLSRTRKKSSVASTKRAPSSKRKTAQKESINLLDSPPGLVRKSRGSAAKKK